MLTNFCKSWGFMYNQLYFKKGYVDRTRQTRSNKRLWHCTRDLRPLLEPFSTTRTSGEVSGTGLAIVEQHNGRIVI